MNAPDLPLDGVNWTELDYRLCVALAAQELAAKEIEGAQRAVGRSAWLHDAGANLRKSAGDLAERIASMRESAAQMQRLGIG